MNIIFLGPPGVGKGTQSVRVAETYRVPHISTGDMMRRAIADQTELGPRVKAYLDSGQLVPDELVVDLVAERLKQSDCEAGCLLDGFPRTKAQAEALDAFLNSVDRKLDAVLQLTADADVLQARMLDRASKEGRSDDNPETIAKRLEVYEQQTAPLVDYYRTAGLLHAVDGIGTPDEVFGRVCDLLNRFN